MSHPSVAPLKLIKCSLMAEYDEMKGQRPSVRWSATLQGFLCIFAVSSLRVTSSLFYSLILPRSLLHRCQVLRKRQDEGSVCREPHWHFLTRAGERLQRRTSRWGETKASGEAQQVSCVLSHASVLSRSKTPWLFISAWLYILFLFFSHLFFALRRQVRVRR